MTRLDAHAQWQRELRRDRRQQVVTVLLIAIGFVVWVVWTVGGSYAIALGLHRVFG